MWKPYRYLGKQSLEFRNHACCVCYILNLFHRVHIPHLFRNYHTKKNRCCDWSKWCCLRRYLRLTSPFDCQQCKQRETARLGYSYWLNKRSLPSYIFWRWNMVHNLQNGPNWVMILKKHSYQIQESNTTINSLIWKQ